MLDSSRSTIADLREKYQEDFQQLRTPLTRYAPDFDWQRFNYGLDNGAFTQEPGVVFERMALDAIDDPLCSWVVMPDVVCDSDATRKLFDTWVDRLGFQGQGKLAFVLQDGATISDIPLDEIDCLFIGGSDKFKDQEARYIVEDILALQEARHLVAPSIHVGRVNGPTRAAKWYDLADTCDGSGTSRFSQGGQLERLVQLLQSLRDTKQQKLDLEFSNI